MGLEGNHQPLSCCDAVGKLDGQLAFNCTSERPWQDDVIIRWLFNFASALGRCHSDVSFCQIFMRSPSHISGCSIDNKSLWAKDAKFWNDLTERQRSSTCTSSLVRNYVFCCFLCFVAFRRYAFSKFIFVAKSLPMMYLAHSDKFPINFDSWHCSQRESNS